MGQHEIEAKFMVSDAKSLRSALREVTVDEVEPIVQTQLDVYFAHPCRDFRASDEVLRMRYLDGIPHITYKGPKQPEQASAASGPQAGDVKVREELEWALGPGDSDGQLTGRLLEVLGFRRVAEVRKRRELHACMFGGREITVAIDQVAGLGDYVELEVVVPTAVESFAAAESIRQLAVRLGLRSAEPRSYLELVLEGRTGS